MDPQNLFDKLLGSHFEVKGSYANGLLQIDVANSDIGASLSFKLPAKGLLEFLAKVIPGTLDDAIFKVAENALGAQ